MARVGRAARVSSFAHSKIASFPIETLARIFILGSEANVGQPDAYYDLTYFPVLVSHVCRRWRDVALSTSGLWNSILVCQPFAFPINAISDDDGLKASRLVETAWLQRILVFLYRSKSSPLTLYVDVRLPSWFFRNNEYEHPFTAGHMSALLDIFLPHIDRWNEVEIISDSWPPLGKFLDRCRDFASRNSGFSTRSLQRLALVRANAYICLEDAYPFPRISNSALELFKETPSLRHVTLSGVHVDWSDNFLCNLTELSLKYHSRNVSPTSSDLVDMINSSPNLKILRIHGWGIQLLDDGISGLEGRICLTSIRELSIGWINVVHCMKLFILFDWHMPELESIALEDVTNSLDPLSEQDSSSLLDYISSNLAENRGQRDPHGGVSELTLNCVRSSFDSFRRLTSTLPRLRALTLHNVNDMLLRIIDPVQGRSEEDSLLCPELMRVVFRTFDRNSTSGLERMARQRDAACSAMLSSSHSMALEIVDLNKFDEDEDLLLSFSVDEDCHETLVEDVSAFLGDRADMYLNDSEESIDGTPLLAPWQSTTPLISAMTEPLYETDKGDIQHQCAIRNESSPDRSCEFAFSTNLLAGRSDWSIR